MHRRTLLIGAMGAALAPVHALSQQSKSQRVGLLSARARLDTGYLDEFLKGMRELGYVEGRNIRYEWRYAEGRMDRLDRLASELVQAKVDVIVVGAITPTLAAQKATRTIPIVFVGVADPVASGLVANLARPGGNITGLSMLLGDLGAKQLEMLLRTVPKASRIAVLTNPANVGNQPTVLSIREGARKAGLPIDEVGARSAAEIERAFELLAARNTEALVVTPDVFLIQQRRQIVALANKLRIPASYGLREFAEAGGLLSYGLDLGASVRRAAVYVDKILKGASPGELPVEQPTKLELVINARTAQVLGIRFPAEVQALADKVIE